MSAASGGGGSFLRFSVGGRRLSAQHVAYLTREDAVAEREAGLLLFNLPDDVGEAHGYGELRTNLVAYATARAEVEQLQHQSRGEPRTHYRALLSFEQDLPTERALALTREWLQQELPRTRAVGAVHRDTEHVHVHLWIDARQVDGQKLRLEPERYRSLDEGWNRIYSRELGRDPAEHLRRKAPAAQHALELAPEAPRVAPPRAQRTPQELEPHWQRREVGAYAAVPGRREATGDTFLERVRDLAGEDLRRARSWEELQRRLERHGLRLEPYGRGLVITDGIHHVKASAVERTASLPQLEQRFGEPLAEHRRGRGEEPSPSRAVEAIRNQVQALEGRRWTQADATRLLQAREAAEARLASLRWRQERAESAEVSLELALQRVYLRPTRAREAWEERARSAGAAVAVEELRRQPERFGELRAAERPRLLGLLRAPDVQAAREQAGNAAELGRQLLEARAAAPGAPALAQAERELQRLERGARQLSGRAEHAPSRTAELARLGLAARQLSPADAAALERLLSTPQRLLVAVAKRGVERLLPQQLQELTRWATAPQRQLPRSLRQAFTAVLRDADRERGIG